MSRNLIGYKPGEITLLWPNHARLAINFVINYEEGAELSPVNGDDFAESYGAEFPFCTKKKGERNLSMESYYEYGSRIGIWRLVQLFDKYSIPLSFFVTAYALILNPLFSAYLEQSDHEVVGHGWRWIDYSKVSKRVEKQDILRCVNTLEELTAKKVEGWYTGRRSEHTRELLLEIGGFIYDSDSYADDLPYTVNNHLIIPYSLHTNDFRFTTNPGFISGEDFFIHLKNTFDYLYQEQKTAIMTIGLHPRISGRPGTTMAIKQFLDYLKQFNDIWIAKRIDIAHYWLSR